VTVLNDADAAGLAEAAFGACHGRSGNAVVLTFGTGIGSALLCEGQLIANTELGQLTIPDDDGRPVCAETIASARVWRAEQLSWDAWADRANRLLDQVALVTQAELLVIGGGMGEPQSYDGWRTLLRSRADVLPAAFGNRAGIIGAALRAAEDA
jgi:polyphosphate glucokinase